MTKFKLGMAAAAAAVLAFGVAACGQTTTVEEPAAVDEAAPAAEPAADPAATDPAAAPADPAAAPAEGAAPATPSSVLYRYELRAARKGGSFAFGVWLSTEE